jgi:predicted nucleotidyltransferase
MGDHSGGQTRDGEWREEVTLDRLFTALEEWAETQEEITGVLLVGSHARGQARPDSDVDVVILAHDPERYLADVSFVHRFGSVTRMETEDWGRVTSLRVWYGDDLEVEFSLTDPGWAALPLDPGTAQVVSDGARLLFDRDGMLAALLAAVRSKLPLDGDPGL